MNKKQAIDFVISLKPHKYRLGLEKMELFLSRAGNPENLFQSILVAGTNGKGSTASFIAQVLQEAGYCVGKYTSPFLYDFNERIQVNGKKISDKELVSLVTETKKQNEKFGSDLSFFEFVTCMAFKHFAKKQADIAVLEIGMGGKKDATNVVKNVLGSVITNIALEHTQWLGKTRKKIAAEKAGIIKENSVLCTTETDAKIRAVFEKKCREKNSSFFYFPKNFSFKRKKFTAKKQVFDFSFGEKRLDNLEAGLLGMHQLCNASLAVALLLSLREKIFVSEKDIRKGLEKTVWRGRFEVLKKKPFVVFDACHNPAGMTAFRKTFSEIFPKKKALVVFGCSADKDAEKMLAALRPIAESLIACRAKFRGMETKKIAAISKKAGFKEIKAIGNVGKAVSFALKQGTEIICVCGSIFVLSEAQKAL